MKSIADLRAQLNRSEQLISAAECGERALRRLAALSVADPSIVDFTCKIHLMDTGEAESYVEMAANEMFAEILSKAVELATADVAAVNNMLDATNGQ